jgi:predicted  nucleic acid-binding Zn-ribbon protein
MPKKTAAEKAQQELDIAERRVSALQKAHDDVQQRFTQLTEALQRARARRDYLKQNPDLPEDVM